MLISGSALPPPRAGRDSCHSRSAALAGLGKILLRLGLGEGVATVELGGAPMRVQDLDGRALAEDPVTWLRVLRRDAAVEWRGQRLAGIRVVPAGAAPLRFQQRPYPGIIDVVGAPE